MRLRFPNTTTVIRQAIVLAAVLSVACPVGVVAGRLPDESGGAADAKGGSLKLPAEIVTFLRRHCLECHGTKEPGGDLSLQGIANGGTFGVRDAKTWQRVLEQIESGAMPPEEADAKSKPGPALRGRVLVWIRQSLRHIGQPVDLGHRSTPSTGNWLDHDLLFAAPTKPPHASGSLSRGRLWRLTGKAYLEFIQSLNVRYRLGFRTYGNQRVRSPWELSAHGGFRDYAALHRIGEPEIEHHLRNARRVARAIIARLPKRGGIPALKVVLNQGKTSTSKQVQAAVAAAFEGLIGRKPNSDEESRYAGFLRSSLEMLEPDTALEQLLVAVLCHLEVMYRIELPEVGQQRSILPPRDLARAIAYAVTDREPDAELLKAVSIGKLTNSADVAVQVTRLLADSELAKPRILRFFQEYFGYTAAIDVFKDSTTRKQAGFRGKNDWHPNFFVSDTDRLIEWVVATDRDVLFQLLTTNKTFTVTGNTKQARGIPRYPKKPFSLFAQTALDIYEIGITRMEWSADRPFEMPAKHRMGILTHPSWLIAHSTNFDNNAIDRGRWIREKLLGGRIPNIPVTVDAQLPDEPEHTLRRRMHVTREAACWTCHRYMDPLGLPFEQFDHFGRYRTAELDKPVETGGRIQGSGETAIDSEVKDPFELISRLARSKRVQQVFVRHVFRYFMGRNETLGDGPTLVAAHSAYVEGGGSLNALITSILTSDGFLYRSARDPGSETVRRDQ